MTRELSGLGELVFVGLGLHDEKDISLRGLEEMKEADTIFAELYTSVMHGLSIRRLEKLIEKRILVVSRRILEEEKGQMILQHAEKGKSVLLVPGDPLIATTHVDLRIRAEMQGIKTRVIHGASVMSAVVGLSGLQNYKFGRSVTIPFPEDRFISETPYNVICENRRIGLHTLCFLDIRADDKRYMTVNDGLEILLTMESRKRSRVVIKDSLVVGVARAGSETPVVKAGTVENVVNYNFGDPPHIIIFPGKLHFMEAEALIKLAGAPEEVREQVQ